MRGPREHVCGHCGYRHFLTPIPAAVVLVLDAERCLLLARRAHAPGLGLMGLPGGVIEPGESGELAAVRELFEEVGLAVPVEAVRYLGSGNNEYLYQDFVWPTLDLFYVVQVKAFGETHPDPAEVSEVCFRPLGDVKTEELAFPTHKQAVEMLRSQLQVS